MPFDDADVPSSSCYVIPIMIEQDGRQAEVSGRLRERGIQTSIFYPAIHRFTAYRERFPDVSLPITELAARTELTLPFYPHMTHDDQDRVVDRAGRGGRAMSDWRVPLTDVAVTEHDVQAVLDCLESGWLTMGPRTHAFEQALADYVGIAARGDRLERHRRPAPRLPGGRDRPGRRGDRAGVHVRRERGRRALRRRRAGARATCAARATSTSTPRTRPPDHSAHARDRGRALLRLPG